MKMKTVIILTSIIVLIGVLYFWGIRFSSKDIICRKISFHKVKNIDCGFWKYAGNGDGYIVDFLVFDNLNHCRIDGDTLFIENEPKAVVIKVIQRYAIGDYTMTLKRIPDGEECHYVAK